MKTMILAALAALSIGIGSAYAQGAPSAAAPQTGTHQPAPVIPTALGFDLCPIAGSDRGYHLGFRHERFPGIAAGIDDGVVGVPHAVA